MRQTANSNLIAAALFFFAQALALGGDLSLSSSFQPQLTITDHALISNSRDAHGTGELPSNLLLHEDSLRLEYRQYSADIQFSNRFRLGGKPQADVPFKLEKKTVAADWEKWELKVGDSHQELGRGIALSLYQDDVLGVNNTLEGAALRFRPQGLDTQLFGGRLNSVTTPVAIYALENPLVNRSMLLAGVTVKANAAEDTKFSGHYFAALQQLDRSTRYNRSWHTVGTSFSQGNIFGAVDFYGEANVLVSQLAAGGQFVDVPTGYGNFAAISFSSGQWTVKLDAKDYRAYNFEFRRPPTLEDDVVETQNTQDVSASRLQVIRKLANDSTVTGSFLGGYDWQSNAPLYHGIGSTKIFLVGKSNLELKFGYRSIASHNNLLHASVKTRVPLSYGQALELEVRKLYAHNKLDVLPVVDDRNIGSLTFTFSERFNLGVGYEYVPSIEDASPHFFNASGTYKTGALTAKAFVGQTSGGTLCSGGVCRQVPPFTGAYLETSYTF